MGSALNIQAKRMCCLVQNARDMRKVYHSGMLLATADTCITAAPLHAIRATSKLRSYGIQVPLFAGEEDCLRLVKITLIRWTSSLLFRFGEILSQLFVC